MKTWMMRTGIGLCLSLCCVCLSMFFPSQASSERAGQETLWAVKVHADWCNKCQRIDAAYKAVQSKYAGRIRFIVLDVTDRKRAKTAAKTAKSLGLTPWFGEYKTVTSVIAVIDPESKRVLHMFFNEAEPTAYETVLDRLLRRQGVSAGVGSP